MANHSVAEITEMLRAWGNGDETALEQLTPLVYDELQRLARLYLAGERPNHTLQTTALINETYLRLIDWQKADWQNRAQFFGVAAQLMRRVLIDFARARHYAKRGGGAQPVALDEVALAAAQKSAELVALDDALKSLAQTDERKCRVVELRFFGGLSVDETAEALKLSPRTVMREWELARAWLYRELEKD